MVRHPQVESLKASDSQLQDAVVSLSKQRAELHHDVVTLEGEVRACRHAVLHAGANGWLGKVCLAGVVNCMVGR